MRDLRPLHSGLRLQPTRLGVWLLHVLPGVPHPAGHSVCFGVHAHCYRCGQVGGFGILFNVSKARKVEFLTVFHTVIAVEVNGCSQHRKLPGTAGN